MNCEITNSSRFSLGYRKLFSTCWRSQGNRKLKLNHGFYVLLPQVQQKFFKYPQPEYPFNYVDNLISGDYTELKDAIKCRRLLFNIVPPKVCTNMRRKGSISCYACFRHH